MYVASGRLTPCAPTARGDPTEELRRGAEKRGRESPAGSPLHCPSPGIAAGWAVPAGTSSARTTALGPLLVPPATCPHPKSHSNFLAWCPCSGETGQANRPGAGLGACPHAGESCSCSPANFSQQSVQTRRLSPAHSSSSGSV